MATILIVEDEIPINELIKRNLQSVGHTCISVFNGRKAIHELSQHEVDLVVLDIMLPEIDGYEVFQQIRGTPTIFLTALKQFIGHGEGLDPWRR